MKPAKTITLRPPRTRKRAHWAMLLFLALALGAATAGMLNQQSGRPPRTTLPGGVTTSFPATATAPVTGAPTASGTPSALAVPTLTPLPRVPVPTVTVLAPQTAGTASPTPRATPSATSRPSIGPTRPPSTPVPTRTPTRTPTPTPTPVVASPRISAVATGSSYRAGAYVRGKVVVSGLPAGYAGDVTLQLHGPFGDAADLDCSAGSVVRTDTVRVTGDGTWSGPAKAITRRGFYVWEANLPAGPSSLAASSVCPTRAGRFEVTW